MIFSLRKQIQQTMQNKLNIEEKGHRNPSHSKIPRPASKKHSIKQDKSKSTSTPQSHSKKDLKYLHKTFEAVYLQNLELTDLVAKKKKAYERLLFEEERNKRVKDPHSYEDGQNNKNVKELSEISSVNYSRESSMVSEKMEMAETDSIEGHPLRFLKRNLNALDFSPNFSLK